MSGRDDSDDESGFGGGDASPTRFPDLTMDVTQLARADMNYTADLIEPTRHVEKVSTFFF